MDVKFPENVKINKLLMWGDRQRIAEMTGHARSTIYDMMIGKRRLTDKVMKAILKINQERKDLAQKLQSETITQNL
jgi:hypothetical protein